MLLTIFYMVATWVQSWRLSSLRARLQSILQGPESSKATVMLYTTSQLLVKEGILLENSGKSKLQYGNCINTDILSSHFCSNSKNAKLSDLLWYQGDKRLCTIFPQQKVDVSNWLIYPCGTTIFPLFAHNNAQALLQQNAKMHVLIEADLNNYIPHASAKASKLEDYGLIVSWTSDDIFGVILETDLDHITKFSTTLMQGQCFINNGLAVTRIESVSVSGKPCVCNYDCFNLVESRKLIGSSQWDLYVNKLKLVGSAARIVSQQNEAMEVKDIPGLIVSPGSKPITLQMPTILEITLPTNDISEGHSVPSTPPPTPASASAIINGTASKLTQALNDSIELNPSSVNHSLSKISNLSSSKSQESILEENSRNSSNSSTPFRCAKEKKVGNIEKKMSSIVSSRSSLCSIAVSNSPSKKTEISVEMSRKPPAILIFADSAVAGDNIRSVLETTLKEDKYTIYTVSGDEACSDVWMNDANLVVVCGNVGSDVASQVVEYVVRGGKLLALCSDILKALLPTFKTAEVRENELVRFSYGKWKHVRMMHHVFCYQASPVKTKFSQDSEESKTATPPTPVSASLCDRSGKTHTFAVQVLGSEETWHTPSILLASLPEVGGKAVFSQIHLEADPSQYEFEESKFNALKQSDQTRLEIFSDLLGSHLGVQVNSKPKPPATYTPGFFLGRHELKLELLKKLKNSMQPNDVLKTTKLEIQFCDTSSVAKPASSTYMPIMVHRCPDNFSTVEYFENLKTEALGRLVIYVDTITSSTYIINDQIWHHGLAVIPRRQTKGVGRRRNTWLSPLGCAMYSLQLHIPLNSVLGQRISLIQHLNAIAIVLAIKSIPGYENIDIKVKWPNDIYTRDKIKIGGTSVASVIQSTYSVCNLGTGINLDNSSPTTCINDLIKRYNEENNKKLKKLSCEQLLALIFNQLETLINAIQEGKMDGFFEIYYKHWMHTDEEITVTSADGTSQEVQILGIDEYGFLIVKNKTGKEFTVHPDGNSFDIFSGLVAPKKL